MRFEIGKGCFLLDGKELKIISGAVHYFRNMPDTWRDIFKKMRALGCNCVETYCPWNMHESKPGKFDFTGGLDVAGFLRMAQEEGLFAIVRPGPYICAEWELGGLPWWLLAEEGLEIRAHNQPYLARVKAYFTRLFEELRPLLCTNGGPILMMQCENEYGCYGSDKRYLNYLRELFVSHGINVPLCTSDAGSEERLLAGSIEGCLATVNFGSRVEERFAAHKQLFPDSPRMCMELWNGWFDGWGDKMHHTTSADDYAQVVEDMLQCGSLNIYMLIGGTNFGFMNGAVHAARYAPHVTSYDYDALLTECGDVTEKYLEVRRVIERHTGKSLPPVPPNRKKMAYGSVQLVKSVGLFANLERLSAPVTSRLPQPMELYGQGYGYIAYRVRLDRDCDREMLTFAGIGDRAQIFVNQRRVGTIYINDACLETEITAKTGDVLTVLCENMGRVNFGEKMARQKGIVGACLLGGKPLCNWQVYPLPMDRLQNIDYTQVPEKGEPRFFVGCFNAAVCADTFLYLEGLGKGFVVINGFCLGRYWKIGPQKSLYVPASVLREGENQLIVFDSEGEREKTEVVLRDFPSLA